MQFRRMMGVAAIALTLFTVGCSSKEEGGETTTPPAEQTTAPAEGMGTQSTPGSEAPATAETGASDAGAGHTEGGH